MKHRASSPSADQLMLSSYWVRIFLFVVVFPMGVVRAQAGLPAIVDGAPLPSLAPMVETVLPAVVNISTRGRVSMRENPLMQDPFFRRFFGAPGLSLIHI